MMPDPDHTFTRFIAGVMQDFAALLVIGAFVWAFIWWMPVFGWVLS